MGSSILFVPLHANPHKASTVAMASFRDALAQFHVELPVLPDGSHSLDICSREGAPLALHELSNIVVADGCVASFGIERPCSPGSHQFWFALLRVGFVLIPSDGPVFANAEVANEVEYLYDRRIFPQGVRVVASAEGFSW
jgi:hypothetical protein